MVDKRIPDKDLGFGKALLLFAFLTFLPYPCWAALAPPMDVKAFDTPNDAGGSNTVTWKVSPQDSLLLGYSVKRSTSPDGPFQEAGIVLKGQEEFQDQELKDGQKYYYRVDARVLGIPLLLQLPGLRFPGPNGSASRA